jgi:hypothetical protein
LVSSDDKVTQRGSDKGTPSITYTDKCSKCGRMISGISQNTLTINMAEHMKKHELSGD